MTGDRCILNVANFCLDPMSMNSVLDLLKVSLSARTSQGDFDRP